MSQRNILKAYAFRTQYPTQYAMLSAWLDGEKFCLTLLPHPTDPLLISIRDDDQLRGFTHLALTDPLMQHRILVSLEKDADNGTQLSPAEAALLDQQEGDPQREDHPGTGREGSGNIRIDLLGEKVDEDGQLRQAALSILAAMMASPAHMDTPIEDMVEESIEAAAALLHKIYGCD